MRCHFVYDNISKQKVLIPGCDGSLHRDDLRDCCCPKPQKSQNQFEKEEYNKTITLLREEIEHLTKEYNKPLRIVSKINRSQ